MKTEKKITSQIVVLITSLVIVSVLWGLLFFLVKKESTTLKNLTAELLAEEQKERDLQAVQELLLRTHENRERLDAYFISEDNAAGFLERIETLATSTNVSLTLTTFEKFDKGLRLGFIVRGSFEHVYHYLVILENLPLRFHIERLGLKAVTGSNGKIVWEGNFISKVESFLSKE